MSDIQDLTPDERAQQAARELSDVLAEAEAWEMVERILATLVPETRAAFAEELQARLTWERQWYREQEGLCLDCGTEATDGYFCRSCGEDHADEPYGRAA